jgi:hypothetical protein
MLSCRNKSGYVVAVVRSAAALSLFPCVASVPPAAGSVPGSASKTCVGTVRFPPLPKEVCAILCGEKGHGPEWLVPVPTKTARCGQGGWGWPPRESERARASFKTHRGTCWPVHTHMACRSPVSLTDSVRSYQYNADRCSTV